MLTRRHFLAGTAAALLAEQGITPGVPSGDARH